MTFREAPSSPLPSGNFSYLRVLSLVQKPVSAGGRDVGIVRGPKGAWHVAAYGWVSDHTDSGR